MKINFLFFSTFAISYAFASSSNSVNLGDLESISEEIIKPALPREYNYLIGNTNESDAPVRPASPSDVIEIPKKRDKKANFVLDGIVFGKEMLTEEVMNMLGAAQSFLLTNDFQPNESSDPHDLQPELRPHPYVLHPGMSSHPYVRFVEDHFNQFLENRSRKVCLNSLWEKTIVKLVGLLFPKKTRPKSAKKFIEKMGFKPRKGFASFSKKPKQLFIDHNIIGYKDSPQIITYFLYVLAQHEKNNKFKIKTLDQNLTYFEALPNILSKKMDIAPLITKVAESYLSIVTSSLRDVVQKGKILPKELSDDPFTKYVRDDYITTFNLWNDCWKCVAISILKRLFDEFLREPKEKWDLNRALFRFVQGCGYYYISLPYNTKPRDPFDNAFASFNLQLNTGFSTLCLLLFEFYRLKHNELNPESQIGFAKIDVQYPLVCDVPRDYNPHHGSNGPTTINSLPPPQRLDIIPRGSGITPPRIPQSLIGSSHDPPTPNTCSRQVSVQTPSIPPLNQSVRDVIPHEENLRFIPSQDNFQSGNARNPLPNQNSQPPRNDSIPQDPLTLALRASLNPNNIWNTRPLAPSPQLPTFGNPSGTNYLQSAPNSTDSPRPSSPCPGKSFNRD